MENDMIIKKLLCEHRDRLKYLIQDANVSLEIRLNKLNEASEKVNERTVELRSLNAELVQVEKELAMYGN